MVRKTSNAHQKCKNKFLRLTKVSALGCLSLYSNMNLASFPDSDLLYFYFLYCVQSIYKCTFLMKLEVSLDLFFHFIKTLMCFF